METAAHQYWMWMKRREILMKSSFGDSTTNTSTWEEKAFAEDANGSLNGGCVWPPRSYSCSFCKREFRSAQALGGHMNVHRRDRARLKHSLSLQNLNQNNSLINSLSLDPKIPSNDQACTTLSSSRVSGLSTQENLSGNNFVSPDNYYTKKFLNISSSSSSVSKPKYSQTLEKNPREEESIMSISLQDDHDDHHHDFVETSLSVGLKPSGMSCGEESTFSCKRTKTAVSTVLPNFFISNNHKYHLQMEVLGFRSGSKENLDLELRLGDSPKVK